MINLSDISQEPLQAQLYRQIRASVLRGELLAGDPLPSIRKLAKEQRVSVITVQKAYENLERSGFIHARRGKGYYISDISDEKRNEIIISDLSTNIEPVIKKAILDGLYKNQIKNIINNIIKDIK